MYYKEFKNKIESVTTVDQKIYDELVTLYGKDTVNCLFEQYIIDPSIEDDINKINRTRYYIEQMESKNGENLDISHIGDNSDSVKMYLSEIGRIPLLNPEEEIKLATKITELKQMLDQKGITEEYLKTELEKFGYTFKIREIKYIISKITENVTEQNHELALLLNSLNLYYSYQSAVEKFYNSNLRLVVNIAKKYIKKNLDFLDLIQEGNIGLKKAIDKYDVEKGMKFSTYATWWVRQAITRALADQTRTIRIPVHLHDSILKVRTVQKKLESIYLRQPTDAEIVAEFRRMAKEKLFNEGIKFPTEQQIQENTLINFEKLEQIKKVNQGIVSIDAPIRDEEAETIGDFIPSHEESVESIVIRKMEAEYVNTMLNVLTIKEKLILVLRFGLKLQNYISLEEVKEIFKAKEYTDEQITKIYYYLSQNSGLFTLEKTGVLMGVTRERIRQIEAKGLRKLRVKGNKYHKEHGKFF